MKHFKVALPVMLLGAALLLTGCAGGFESTEAGAAAGTSDSVTYNDSSSTAPGTSNQDAINSQIATDAANAAAQASFVADMAATQQAINNDSN